jgi:hypothetical protein
VVTNDAATIFYHNDDNHCFPMFSSINNRFSIMIQGKGLSINNNPPPYTTQDNSHLPFNLLFPGNTPSLPPLPMGAGRVPLGIGSALSEDEVFETVEKLVAFHDGKTKGYQKRYSG